MKISLEDILKKLGNTRLKGMKPLGERIRHTESMLWASQWHLTIFSHRDHFGDLEVIFNGLLRKLYEVTCCAPKATGDEYDQ